MELDASLDTLKGIGEKTRQVFDRAGVSTIEELISYYPRTYERYEKPVAIASLREGDFASILGRLEGPLETRYLRGLSISSAVFGDGIEHILVSWFNMPYLRNSLKSGVLYVFRGRIKAKGQRLILEQPTVFRPEQYEGLTNQMVTKAVRQVIADKQLLSDAMPEAIREQYALAEYNFSIEQIHFPSSDQALQLARRRLVFDEFFYFLLQLRGLKERRERAYNQFHMKEAPETQQLIGRLPYQLTGAQQRVWHTVEQELQGNAVMARLIQGDVGSGKTIVAILALVMAAANHLQGALMVPTEVLARQHFASFTELMGKNGFPFRAELLTGSMTAKQKREAYARIASGEVSVVIGTHALIQEKVQYQNLALVITDEQHRFGVRQRETLSKKGAYPHTIVMSATPIPRTLAVILYGDLDISVINEMPANRLPIKNCVVNTGYRKKAYEFIRREVEAGHQAYVICPMVEESEAIDAENVVEYTEVLRTELPPAFTIEYLHGKMKPKEKNEIMERFLEGEIQVLVSTTVIEVGVNVPNATVMMIENSERDMQLRGPGDLFGVRQSGLLDFALADIYTDADTLQQANEAVGELLAKDPKLEQEGHSALKLKFDRLLLHQNGQISL